MPCIVLIGFMASGKSAIGQRLANLLDVAWVDIDQEIEARAGCSVAEIFAEQGEFNFRRLERESLERALQSGSDTVISAGGGLFIDPGNRALLDKAHAMTIFLDLPFEVLAARARRKPGKRPLFTDEDAARSLFDARRPIYCAAVKHFELDGDHSDEQVAEMIRTQLEARCAISC